MKTFLDRLLDFETRHERPITIVFGAFFVLSCAVYARFIDLPEIPWLSEEALFWSSVGLNAGWHGFARPILDKRKAQRKIEDRTSA